MFNNIQNKKVIKMKAFINQAMHYILKNGIIKTASSIIQAVLVLYFFVKRQFKMYPGLFTKCKPQYVMRTDNVSVLKLDTIKMVMGNEDYSIDCIINDENKDQFYFTQFIFWNNGSELLRRSDYVISLSNNDTIEKMPVIDLGTKIYRTACYRDESQFFRVNTTYSGSHFKFDIIDEIGKNEGFAIYILHRYTKERVYPKLVMNLNHKKVKRIRDGGKFMFYMYLLSIPITIISAIASWKMSNYLLLTLYSISLLIFILSIIPAFKEGLFRMPKHLKKHIYRPKFFKELIYNIKFLKDWICSKFRSVSP